MASNFRIDATGDIHFSSGDTGGIYLDSDVSFFNTRKLIRDSQPSNLVFVQDLDDLPTPDASGVITLAPSTCYYICKDVDLCGNRLETSDEKTTITGSSSETSFLTSTGLGPENPLITSRYTLPITNITIRDVSYGFYIDDNSGANAPLAIDWARMNFSNVPHIGEFGTCDNIIFDTCAMLSSSNLILSGTIGTFGLNNSLMTNFSGNVCIDLSGCTFTRRFKSASSSFVNFGTPSATIRYAPASMASEETFILDTVNFSHNNGYPLDGIDQANVFANFINCNIQNSTSVGDVYIIDSSAQTTITASAEAYVINPGSSATSENTEKFVYEPSLNGLRYVSSIPKTFLVTCNATIASLNGTNKANDLVGLYIAKHDISNVAQGEATASDVTPQADSIGTTEMHNTTSLNREVGFSSQYLTILNKDEVVYPTVENISTINNINVRFLNFIVQRTSI